MYILTINPGSTSTKIAFFENDKLKWDKKITHSAEELDKYDSVLKQDFRKDIILETLKERNIDKIDAVVGRGGPIFPLPSGTYIVDDDLIHALKFENMADHPSLLGGIIAKDIAESYNSKAYIVDPVSVDEMSNVARYSGIKDIPRISLGHALNIKAVAYRAEKELAKSYDKCKLVIAHLGGGISISSHLNGKMVDVNNANEEGPFSPERSGTLPAASLAKLCFSGKYTKDDMKKLITKRGGLISYTGTNDCNEVAQNPEYSEILDAMVYQIAKYIGAYSAVLDGNLDAVIITGGIAHNKRIIEPLKKKIAFLGRILVYPGEDEMTALCEGALRVLNNKQKAKYIKDVKR